MGRLPRQVCFSVHSARRLPWGAFAGVVLTLVLCLAAMTTRADFINLTGAETAANIAEITVLDDRVKLALEIYIGDLEYFEELVPDD